MHIQYGPRGVLVPGHSWIGLVSIIHLLDRGSKLILGRAVMGHLQRSVGVEVLATGRNMKRLVPISWYLIISLWNRLKMFLRWHFTFRKYFQVDWVPMRGVRIPRGACGRDASIEVIACGVRSVWCASHAADRKVRLALSLEIYRRVSVETKVPHRQRRLLLWDRSETFDFLSSLLKVWSYLLYHSLAVLPFLSLEIEKVD